MSLLGAQGHLVLQQRIEALVSKGGRARSSTQTPDVLVLANSDHPRHPLIQRTFADCPDLFVISSAGRDGHESQLGHMAMQLQHGGLPRPAVYARLLSALAGLTPRRIVCIPESIEEVRTAVALRDLFHAPLCTYVLDDRSLQTTIIADDLMRELLEKSQLRLAISPELRDACELKHRRKFYVMPPVARIADWIWDSLARGEACDERFAALERRRPDQFAYYVEPAAPAHIYTDFAGLFNALRRLKGMGFRPDFILDVGASTGIWSHTVHEVFPSARFLLVDPLLDRYGANAHRWLIATHPKFEMYQLAVSDRAGRALFQVSDDLYGSSLLAPKDFRAYTSVEVEVVTLDGLAVRSGIQGRGFLKIDVQYAEHLVLKGAGKLLEQVDLIALELSLYRYDPRAKVFVEMLQLLDQLGFDYFEDVGVWRSPVDGRLLEKDVLFVRKGFLPPCLSRSGESASTDRQQERIARK